MTNIKRDIFQKVVDKRFAPIQKYWDRIPILFDVEDIHELRVEYKKLRAFLRLLQHEPGVSRHLAIPSALKDVYAAAGKVRDLQLHLQKISAYLPGKEVTVSTYVNNLEQKLETAKIKLKNLITKNSLQKIEQGIVDQLPPELKDSTIRKFVHRNIATMQIILLAVEEDEDLHEIRKKLKDLLYNIRMFRQDMKIPFPVKAWKSEKALDDSAKVLGDYNDRAFSLMFFDEEYLDGTEESERKNLIGIRDEWTREKDVLRNEAVRFIPSLNLVSLF